MQYALLLLLSAKEGDYVIFGPNGRVDRSDERRRSRKEKKLLARVPSVQ